MIEWIFAFRRIPVRGQREQNRMFISGQPLVRHREKRIKVKIWRATFAAALIDFGRERSLATHHRQRPGRQSDCNHTRT